ncbi:uncharacterized protein LOC126995412 isoform X2 [Eriocheir sinensis]|uniref:uncharacterized protein LOC126995412 isoform X2 n=1 Tax=Eriocheir sinensis TaxID=95602 RepID=UPI0021CA1B2B|nr:uncharacterized protein LOC126995412 isoform X2 [Eriocheir sinensis]
MMLAGVRTVGGKAVMVVGGGGGGYPVARSHSVIRKVLLQEGKKKSKRKWHTHEAIPKPGDAVASVVSGGGGGEGGKMKRVPKNEPRLRALNKVYLNKISEILSMGDFANDLYGRGLELSEVRIHPDLRGVNVYWMASGEPQQDREMDELLNGHAREIRHQISSLRLLGHSPPIRFFRDDRHHKLQEVERLLALADYGDDFEPTDPSHHLRASVITTTTTTPLPPKLKAAIEDLDRQTDTDKREEEEEEEEKLDHFEDALMIAKTWTQQEEVESVATPTTTTTTTADAATVTLPKDLPIMRGDVLGVNTSKIYKMIQQNMSRAKVEEKEKEEEKGVAVVGEGGGETDPKHPIPLNLY